MAAVWETIISTEGGAEWLASRIVGFELTPESVRGLLASRKRLIRERAFQTLVQNRISRGGILAPGAGVVKQGENGKGLLSRWYPETLRQRILDIGPIRGRIRFVRGDGLTYIRRYARHPNTAFFIDPPYTASTKQAGSRLYKYHQLDHEELFRLAGAIRGDFLMTYDDAQEVRALAVRHRFETRLVAMNSTHHTTMYELLIGRDLDWIAYATARRSSISDLKMPPARMTTQLPAPSAVRPDRMESCQRRVKLRYRLRAGAAHPGGAARRPADGGVRCVPDQSWRCAFVLARMSPGVSSRRGRTLSRGSRTADWARQTQAGQRTSPLSSAKVRPRWTMTSVER